MVSGQWENKNTSFSSKQEGNGPVEQAWAQMIIDIY